MAKELIEPDKGTEREIDPTKSLAVLLKDLGFGNHKFILSNGNVSLQDFEDFVKKNGKEVNIQCVAETNIKGYHICGSPSVEIGGTIYTLTTASHIDNHVQILTRIENGSTTPTEGIFPVSSLRSILSPAIEKNNMPPIIKFAEKIGKTISGTIFRRK